VRILLAFLLVVAWLPSVALASPIWGKNCSHTQADSVSAPSNPVSIIGAGEHAGGLSRRACLGWGTNALSQAGGDESRTLTVRADSALASRR
jgi:hypothetical protein